LTKKIASCWLVAIRDISKNDIAIDSVINFHKERGHLNRTAIFYKIQATIIEKCINVIEIDAAEKVREISFLT
jgi:hypothetical protein